MSSDVDRKVRVQVMVELSEHQQRALSHRLGRKVLLRQQVRHWALDVLNKSMAELVHAYEACECCRYFPHVPRSMHRAASKPREHPPVVQAAE